MAAVLAKRCLRKFLLQTPFLCHTYEHQAFTIVQQVQHAGM